MLTISFAATASSHWSTPRFEGAQIIFLLELIDCLHPLYLRGGVPSHLGFLRAKNVIAMSWSRGLSLRLERADVDCQSGCKD